MGGQYYVRSGIENHDLSYILKAQLHLSSILQSDSPYHADPESVVNFILRRRCLRFQPVRLHLQSRQQRSSCRWPLPCRIVK